MKQRGVSDSSFFRTQKFIQGKQVKYIEQLNKESEREAMLSKFSKASNLRKPKSLWQTVKGWFSE
jgi:hypothetical protein